MSEFNCSASPLLFDPGVRTPEFYNLQTSLFITSLVLGPLMVCSYFLGKFYLRYERLRIRRSIVTVLALIGVMFASITAVGVWVIQWENFPCWLRGILSGIILPTTVLVIVVRLTTFHFLHQLHSLLLGEKTTALDEDLDPARMTKIQSFGYTARTIGWALWSMAIPRSGAERVVATKLTINSLQFVSSPKGILVLFCFAFFPLFILQLVFVGIQPEYTAGCTSCRLPTGLVYQVVAVGVILGLYTCLAVYHVRTYRDPWGIRREIIYMCLGLVLTMLGFVMSVFDLSAIAPDVWTEVGLLWYLFSQTSLQVILGWYYERNNRRLVGNAPLPGTRQVPASQIQDTGSRVEPSLPEPAMIGGGGGPQSHADKHLTLAGVMRNPNVYKSFEQFLAGEFGAESLMFIRDTDEWIKAYSDVSATTRLARVKRLCQYYIQPAGQFSINIPADVIHETTDRINGLSEEDEFRDVFDRARKEIVLLMETGSIKRFHSSEEYRQSLELDRTQKQVQDVVAASNPL